MTRRRSPERPSVANDDHRAPPPGDWPRDRSRHRRSVDDRATLVVAGRHLHGAGLSAADIDTARNALVGSSSFQDAIASLPADR